MTQQEIENEMFGSSTESTSPFNIEYMRSYYSEEAYFGENNTFKTEMVSIVGKLRKELMTLNKTVKAGDFESLPELKFANTLIRDLGNCIARNCNIEKCYISISPQLTASTIPLIYDPEVIVDNSKKDKIVTKRGNVKREKVNSDADIRKRLIAFSDICDIDDGYKFKKKDGKIFLIEIGMPLLINDLGFESTDEDICFVLFHEIGHNFQHVLTSVNDAIIDQYKKNVISINYAFLIDPITLLLSMIVGLIGKCFRIKNFEMTPAESFRLVKMMLGGQVYVNDEGKLITRNDAGKQSEDDLEKILTQLNENKGTGVFTRGLIILGNFIWDSITLICSPFIALYRNIARATLVLNFGDESERLKRYEQFADVFAVSYGFGRNASKFFLNYINLRKSVDEKYRPVPLNYVPVLGTIKALSNFSEETYKKKVAGYDQDHVRIANAYNTLQYELSNNPDLTDSQRKEIKSHVNYIMKDYKEYNDREIKVVAKTITSRFILRSVRGEIEDTSPAGLKENVLDILADIHANGVKLDKIDDGGSTKAISKMSNVDVIKMFKHPFKDSKDSSRIKHVFDGLKLNFFKM